MWREFHQTSLPLLPRPGHQEEDVPFWEEDGYVEMGEGELQHRSEMVTGPLEPQASAPSAPRRNSMPGLTVARRPSATSEKARPSPSSPSSPQPDSKSLDSSVASSFDVWTPQTATATAASVTGATVVLRGWSSKQEREQSRSCRVPSSGRLPGHIDVTSASRPACVRGWVEWDRRGIQGYLAVRGENLSWVCCVDGSTSLPLCITVFVESYTHTYMCMHVRTICMHAACLCMYDMA